MKKQEAIVLLRNSTDHPHQKEMVDSTAKRTVVRAGRRGGKTVGAATRSIIRFLAGRRQLYAAPVAEQTDAFWFEIKKALAEPIRLGAYRVNETERFVELPGTKQRIKCKTAWNADTLRGDYADDLILDEWQLMNEDTWEVVGAPMLVDTNGDALFIYTPPSLRTVGVSKAHDPRHAARMFKEAQRDVTGRWKAIHWTSHDNPNISQEALTDIAKDMSQQAYRQEILAEDDEIQASWLVYRAFQDSRKIQRFAIPLTWPVGVGHDFGQANPAALFAAQARLPLPNGAPSEMRMNDWVVWKEYAPGAGFSPMQHSEAFKLATKGYDVRIRVGGNQNSEDDSRQLYTAHGWPIQAPAIKQPKVQIDRVIALMELGKIWVFSDCFRVLDQLANCLFELGEDGQPVNKIKDEAKYHLLACMRYLFSHGAPEVSIRDFPVRTSLRDRGGSAFFRMPVEVR